MKNLGIYVKKGRRLLFFQEYRIGFPCLPPGDLSNSGIEPRSPTLQVDSSPPESTGNVSGLQLCLFNSHLNRLLHRDQKRKTSITVIIQKDRNSSQNLRAMPL